MSISNDLREFVELLNSNEVEYVVVGALAVAWHGYVRYSADLDILIRPGESNVERVLSALNQFGFGSLGFGQRDLACAGTVIQLGVQPNRIDLLTSVTGVSFEDIWIGRTPGNLYGVPVQFIGREELIRNKEATGRAKDLGDVEELRKRGGQESH